MHLTDDEVQYTMGRTNKKGEVTSCPFPPSHLPLQTNFAWVRGRGHPVLADKSVCPILFSHIFCITNLFSRNTNMSVGLGGCLQSRGFTASFDHNGLTMTDSWCLSYFFN